VLSALGTRRAAAQHAAKTNQLPGDSRVLRLANVRDAPAKAPFANFFWLGKFLDRGVMAHTHRNVRKVRGAHASK
jgi:hypothetical protein